MERIQLQGQLAEAKNKYRNLGLEAKGLIILVRTHLNPYEDDITLLKMEEIELHTRRLLNIHREMTVLKKKIAELEEALHG